MVGRGCRFARADHHRDDHHVELVHDSRRPCRCSFETRLQSGREPRTPPGRQSIVDERKERFRELFDSCYPLVHGYLRRRAAHDDIDDLTAEVFVTAWRRLDDVPGGAELPWLYGVARLTLANHRRGAQRRRKLADRIIRLAPASAASGDSEFDEVHTALARVTPDDRELLRLAAWEQLSTADISVVLGCSENAAALRLSRARRRFRERLTSLDASRTQATWKVTDA